MLEQRKLQANCELTNCVIRREDAASALEPSLIILKNKESNLQQHTSESHELGLTADQVYHVLIKSGQGARSAFAKVTATSA